MPTDEWGQWLRQRRSRDTLFKQGQRAGCGDGDCKEVSVAVTTLNSPIKRLPLWRSR